MPSCCSGRRRARNELLSSNASDAAQLEVRSRSISGVSEDRKLEAKRRVQSYLASKIAADEVEPLDTWPSRKLSVYDSFDFLNTR